MNYTTQSGHNVTEQKALDIMTSAAAAFTYSMLKKVIAKATNGYKYALEVLEGRQPQTAEDLKQEAILYIIEGMQCGKIAFNDLICINAELLTEEETKAALLFVFADAETKKGVFKRLYNYLYNVTVKHEKQTAVKLDTEEGRTIQANNNNILDTVTAAAFADTLTDNQAAAWALMLEGYTIREIAEKLNYSHGKTQRICESVKRLAKEYYTI